MIPSSHCKYLYNLIQMKGPLICNVNILEACRFCTHQPFTVCIFSLFERSLCAVSEVRHIMPNV